MFGKNTRLITITTILYSIFNSAIARISTQCEGGGGLKYLWGDALSDSPECTGPNNMPYPSAAIERSFRGSNPWSGNFRSGRSQKTIDPFLTRNALLAAHQQNIGEAPSLTRKGRAANVSPAGLCPGTPARLCKTRYNTTAPMYGVSLTSGQPVTIVQKFPDLLQQVVFEVIYVRPKKICRNIYCERHKK
nr:uncharacterized protein LOC111508933 [Leptinotarsa decemlineata]